MLTTVIDDRPAETLDDSEIEAYLLRLARSGSVRTGAAFMASARAMFPGIVEARLRSIVGRLAAKLRDQSKA